MKKPRFTTSVLGGAADLHAPPGTSPWAIAVKRELITIASNWKDRQESIGTFLGLFREHEGFRLVKGPDGKPFKTLEAFAAAHPPFGMGILPIDVENVVALARRPTPLARPGEIGRGRNRGDDNHVLRGTTGAAYLTARIARDRPDILDRMRAGEFRSVRSAAIAAGIIKARVKIHVEPTPEAFARAALKHLDAKGQDELIARLMAR